METMTPSTPEDIAARIRPAMTKLYVMYFRIAEQSDLTGPQLSIMARLKDNGPARISQIAREEGIRMPTASNALHQLEQRELVERIRDEHDRRGVRVQLTGLGESELERVGEERTKYLAEMLGTLSEDDLARVGELTDIINKLADNYGADLIDTNDG
ncbi:MAG: MarR family transcriptional regulator [Corynebacterium humireducens]|jgi:DNA-binding MarR family transcriptional regulator|uniref:Multiple antibiotic resistance protein marR n=3 Tax=Corynebacterium humireducens TaxID=1223514 RepID=A0A0B5DDM7_9CORY|nr:MarR family transcriptional regulator [Corynebacterium humireducens]AJE34328.1 Multiple antibiotic resistance protein marR [Corynebacterium humireducens NBRC 106098 = DSM 45392]NLA57257.1 MarR family transcriptional regulator [Corynebacterium humireducens]